MPTHTVEFWQVKRDWSDRKHLVLEYYLMPAIAKLARKGPRRQVYFLDGFAGSGRYEDGGEGSPIYTGRLADRSRLWKSPADLRVFNLEPDSEAFRKLQSATEKWVESGAVTNLNGSFQKCLPDVLHRCGAAPLFAFLDPFRHTDLSFDDLSPLLTRPAATELCIVFHSHSIYRILSAVHPRSRTGQQSRDTLMRTLRQIMGGDRWLPLVQTDGFGPEHVAACFANELQSRAGVRSFVRFHAIESRYGVGLKYHMIFVTRHQDGVRLMNDAFHKESHAAFDSGSQQLSLFDRPAVQLDQQAALDRITQILLEIGHETPQREWNRCELIFESISRSFADFSEAEHRQTVQNLADRAAPPRLIPITGTRLQTGKWRVNDQSPGAPPTLHSMQLSGRRSRQPGHGPAPYSHF
jgi:three-Cys-motif partner protein